VSAELSAATVENEFAYNYLPKLDVPAYDVLRAFELMHQGKMNGYVCQGFNPLMSFPNKGKIKAALGKLKFLVVMDPLEEVLLLPIARSPGAPVPRRRSRRGR